ncbi:MAG TPA: hypothetical protein VHN15_06800, partial [Thermoanaerobaculia bacterium]|nr:hypothetical protein [Thermoanaerobaculia bacterium]
MNPRSYRRVLFASSLAFVLAGSAATEGGVPTSTKEWPQFRGPGRDGISPEQSLLTRWPEEGPRVSRLCSGEMPSRPGPRNCGH